MKRYFSFLKSRKSFTLVEIIIVISILAILSTASVIIINPVEYLKKGRDTQRISDLNNLNTLITKYKFSGKRVSSLGSTSTVYISIPSSSSTCGDLGLPNLPSGWSYRCAPTSTYLNISGTGWLPVDLSGASNLSSLPIDSTNSTSSENYYSFVNLSNSTSSDYILVANNFESKDLDAGGSRDKVSTDGGLDPYAYEVGSNVKSYQGPNIALNGDFSGVSGGYSPGWDTALNHTFSPSSGFFSGYNDGVTSPTIGYHAHVSTTCGLLWDPCFEFIDENTAYGQAHRWLGTYQRWLNPASSMGWASGTIVTVKMMAKVSSTGKTLDFGLYHYSGSAYTFGSARYSNIALSSADEWQEVTKEFTIGSDWQMGDGMYVYVYIYGYFGTEGRLWVDDVKVTYRNP